nr:MAG TPA: hypothetical protein [Caudoviricetes sp.]
MELRDVALNSQSTNSSTKYLRHRHTFPLSCLAVFLCRGKCRADRFDSCTRLRSISQ